MKLPAMKRRGFLQLLGVAPLAPALAAKEAIDSNIAKLTGLSTLPTGNNERNVFPCDDDHRKRYIQAYEIAKLGGDLVKSLDDGPCHPVYALDPDLAAKKSWSMSVKMLTQRERERERNIKYREKTANKMRAELAFKSLTGIEWPW